MNKDKVMEKAFEAQAKIRAIIIEAENNKISWEEAIEKMKFEINSISIEEIEEEEKADEEWKKQYMEADKFQDNEPVGDDLREVETGDFVKVLHEDYIRWGEVINNEEFTVTVKFNDDDRPAEFYLWEIINVEKNQ